MKIFISRYGQIVSMLTCVLLVSTLSFLLRRSLIHIPLERDEGEYAYIAQRWLQGEIPYKDSFDQKPPGVFVLFAWIERFVGQSSGDIHRTVEVYSLVTLLLIGLIGARFFDPLTGFLAAMLATFMTVDLSVLGSAANTEIFLILPATGCLFFILLVLECPRFWVSFVIGLSLMLAIWMKQVAAIYGIPTTLMLVSQPRRRMLLIGLGLGMTVGMTPLFYWMHHSAFNDLLSCVVGYNVFYSLGGNPFNAFKVVVLPYLLVFFPVYAGLGLSLFRLVKHRKVSSFTPHAAVWCWFFFSVWSACIGGFLRMHYLMVLGPPAGLLAAESFSRLIRDVQWPKRWIGILSIVAASVLPFARHGWYYGSEGPDVKSKKIYGQNPFSESEETGEFIRTLTKPDDRVFIFGSEPQILYYAHRRSSSRYIFIYPATFFTRYAEKTQHGIFSELSAKPPPIIVTVFSWFSFLSSARTPRFLFENLSVWVPLHYHIVGLIPESQVVPNALLTYDAALKRWNDQTTLYPPPKGFLLAIWQKKS